MFEEHQSKIGRYARQDADSMAKVYTFVLATIQQSLWQTPEIMQSIEHEGIESRFLWGFKYDAYEYLIEHKATIYAVAMNIWRGHADPLDQEYELTRYFAGLKGLGLVKGGFMVQLCFGLGGCLDSHNITRHGLDERKFKASRFKSASLKNKRSILRNYFAVIMSAGGCEALWDSWCQYVADRQPGRYEDAYAVSALHVKAIGA
jgi:hypothetical protein